MAYTVLIIDDEALILEMCRKMFMKMGFEVVVTANPEEGLQRIKSTFFDVILCDWHMPGRNGLDMIEDIGASAPDSAVVMISGHPSVNLATEAMKRGAMDFVAKPFTHNQIFSVIEDSVRKKLQQKSAQAGGLVTSIPSVQVAATEEAGDKSPTSIAVAVADTMGKMKTKLPWASVFVLGILGGAYIGFGGLFSMVVIFDFPAHWGIGLKKLFMGGAFSLGLVLVVVAGAELFTGNNLMVSSVMSKKISLAMMLQRLVVVYVANFVGALLLVILFYYSNLWKLGDSVMGAKTVAIAANKVSMSFFEALVKGVGCNWLVCLAVWMAYAARQTISKILSVMLPVTGFVAIGFEHCIANMYFIPAGILLNQLHTFAVPEHIALFNLNWGAFVTKNLIPVTLGNLLGGIVFVGMSYWGAYVMPRCQRHNRRH